MDLATFLAQVDKLPQTLRGQRLAHLEAYYEGRQYDDRDLDVNGYRKNTGVYGSMVRIPAWSERDPGASWNMVKEGVRELTAWTLGSDNWCALEVIGDAEATDWLNAAAVVGGFQDAAARARNWGGAMGTAVLSLAVRGGRIAFEAHNPRLTWVLEWRDEETHRPAVVVGLFYGDNPVAVNEGELPLCARVWTELDESIHRRVKDKQTGEWRWEQVSRVAHGLGVCPVIWHPQRTSGGQHDGTPDGEGVERKVDEVNELLAAAGATTKRNADDVLVVKMDPGRNPGEIRKGAYTTIFSTGGAEYLTQDGSSAKICLELADRHAEHVWRTFGVTMAGPKDLGGNTTAELLKRLFQRTINTAGELRHDYAQGLIEPAAEMLLQIGRKLQGKGKKLRIPPREEPNIELGAKVVVERTPGTTGQYVQCLWPPPFPQTVDDLDKVIRAASKAIGDKAVLSRKTALAWLKTSSLPLPSVEEELAQLDADAALAAQQAAEGLGLGGPPKGAAGEVPARREAPPVEDDDQAEPPAEGERPAA